MQHISPVTYLQLLDALETRLGQLAARWRGTQDSQKAESIIRLYQSLLVWMIELGYRDSLDPDTELPDEYLQGEYLALHT